MPDRVPFGRYELLTKIASGGMAELFLARQAGLEGFEKFVAIKRILPGRSNDPKFVELFLQEARLAARLSHANIVQIYDLGKEQDSYFLAMEYVSGENLTTVAAHAQARGERIPVPLAIKIAVDVCQGLYYAHHLTDALGRELRVVHCDISPQNVIVGYDGSVKIVDFGIARVAQGSHTATGEIRGKAGYMSPEQIRGEPLDHAADQFSLGVVLYELLTGETLFARKTFEATVLEVCGGAIPPLRDLAPEIVPSLEAIVLRALERDPTKRYPTTRALQQDLEAVLAAQGGVPSDSALGEYMTALFRDTLDKRRFVQQAQTAIIPLSTKQLAPARPIAQATDDQSMKPSSPRRALRWLSLGAALLLTTLGVALATRTKHAAPVDPVPVPLAAAAASPPTDPSPRVDEPAERSSTVASAVAAPVEKHHHGARYGWISINSDPWTNVTLDGSPTGSTPIRDVKIAAGTHTVGFANERMALKATAKIRVVEGAHAQHRFQLQRQGDGWRIVRHVQL